MLHVVYEDASVLVINKASGVLSQPGKHRDGSIVSEVRRTREDARGPLLVHRLDMDTSGLIILGKTRDAHRHLQQQFEHRKIQKRYTALLERQPESAGGLIHLPIIKDWENRPRQRVCLSTGKPALTAWRLAAQPARDPRYDQAARVRLYPKTGRTHQLRVHAASGLGIPIIGDRLYGSASTRLMLHADRLTFLDPATNEPITVAVEAAF